MTIPGHKNVDIRNIHWVEPDNVDGGKKDSNVPDNILYYQRSKNSKVVEKKRRLITTGLNGMVIEWDLLTCKTKSTYHAGGAIYDSKVLGKFVYLACEDGSIRIIKIKKKKIELVKMLVKSDAACISIAVQESEKKHIVEKIKKEDSSDESEMDIDEV